MKVCIDIQSTIAQRAGVGRYTRQLVRHLGAVKGKDDDISLFFFDFKRRGLDLESSGASLHPVRFCPGRLTQLAWKYFNWPSFDFFAPPADLYHFPNFILPPLAHGKSVVTIHDMSFLRFPNLAEKRNLEYLSSRIHDTAHRADALITDSRFSAREIHEFLKVPMEKIFPIHLGISDDFKAPPAENIKPALQGIGINRPYILTVGTIEPRKNVEFLIRVFEKMDKFDGNLVIAGMYGWKYEPILERIKNSIRSKDIICAGHVDDALLPALYAGAELFMCGSLYEGFGFPPLEAMSCGTPVLSSNGGSLAEVLGAGAVVLHEFNLDMWQTHAMQLLSDSELRKRMIEEGHKTVQKYSWSDTARKTWDVYKKIV